MVRFDTSQYFMSASGKFAKTQGISPLYNSVAFYIFSIKFRKSLPRILHSTFQSGAPIKRLVAE